MDGTTSEQRLCTMGSTAVPTIGHASFLRLSTTCKKKKGKASHP